MKINLLSIKPDRFGRAQRIRIANRWLIKVVLVSLATSFVVVLGLLLFYSYSVRSKEVELANLKKSYEGRVDEVVRYVGVKVMVAQVEKIIGSRGNYPSLVRNAYKIFPENVLITQTSFDQLGNIKISGKTDSVIGYRDFLDFFRTVSARDDFMFSNVVQDGLTYSDGGQVVVNIKMRLKGKK